MRGIAAVLIAVRHVDDIVWPIRFGASYLALDLFFLLSGTVICHAYEQPLLAGLPLRRFLYARLVRIYPLYLLGTLIGASVSLLQPGLLQHGLHAGDLVSRLGLALLLLPDLASPVLYPLNNPAWSLFFELCANLVYALLLRYRLWVGPALLAVLSALALVALVIQAPTQALDIGWTRQTILAGFPRVGFSFFAGVLLYRAFARREHSHAVPSWLPLAVITAALIASPGPGLQPWYDLAVAMLAFPAAVYAALACRPAARLARACARACALGGLVSYPVYALHVPLAALLGQAATMLLGPWWLDTAPIPGLLFLAALGPVALLVHHRFDVPVRRALLPRRA